MMAAMVVLRIDRCSSVVKHFGISFLCCQGNGMVSVVHHQFLAEGVDEAARAPCNGDFHRIQLLDGHRVTQTVAPQAVGGGDDEPPKFEDLATSKEVLFTGIKVIDLLEPYLKGGKIGLFGGAGVGKTVLIMELINNIAKGYIMCWPREVLSSIRVSRESWGLLSSHCRAK